MTRDGRSWSGGCSGGGNLSSQQDSSRSSDTRLNVSVIMRSSESAAHQRGGGGGLRGIPLPQISLSSQQDLCSLLRHERPSSESPPPVLPPPPAPGHLLHVETFPRRRLCCSYKSDFSDPQTLKGEDRAANISMKHKYMLSREVHVCTIE